MSYKIAAIKESVGVEEIEAVGTDHSFWKFGSKKERKDHSWKEKAASNFFFYQHRGNLSVYKGYHLRIYSDWVKVFFPN